MNTETILDVTVIEPRLKHAAIFEHFDELLPGQSLVIHNDHDPKPLYYQFIAERGRIFNWDYLQKGPEFWQVRIGKRSLTGNTETVGDIVTKDFRKAQVFKKFGIDFCCGGRKTLAEVCDKKGIDLVEVEHELTAAEKQDAAASRDFENWDIGFLSDYVVNVHHHYIRENSPFIEELAQKVAKVHGQSHPELVQVAAVFSRVARDLGLHLAKEEKILFPRIKALGALQASGEALTTADIGGVVMPIQVMESEHEQAGEDFDEIRSLTSGYRLPQDACRSYTVLFKKLEEFEDDLHQHVHLENNILFPRAIAAEQALA